MQICHKYNAFRFPKNLHWQPTRLESIFKKSVSSLEKVYIPCLLFQCCTNKVRDIIWPFHSSLGQISNMLVKMQLKAILHLIVEGIEYERISELFWGKSLIWGETILLYPSLAPTLTFLAAFIWNIKYEIYQYKY